MMNRAKQIREELLPFCPDMNSLYTNQEIVDALKKLQDALSKGVFEKTHAEHLKAKDILIHFDALASEYNLKESDTYIRFKKNMNTLGYTIGSFINGMKGEKAARQALKRLTYMDNVEVLYNVQLEGDDCYAEYDAILIASYGIFVIEVKNWTEAIINSDGFILNPKNNITYDMLGRLSIKEALLRETLGQEFPENYTNILMFPNADSNITDEYKNVHIVKGAGISYILEPYIKNCGINSNANISNIKNKILSNHKEQFTFIPVNCNEIIDDYSLLMAQIETASQESAKENYNQSIPDSNRNKVAHQIPWSKCIKWGSLFAGGVLYCYKLYSDNLKRK